MAKSTHPARRARNLTGAVSALALVGMVTSFQLSAVAKENSQADAVTPVPTSAEVAPAAATVNQPTTAVAPVASAPAEQVVIVVDTAPAAPAPAPAEPAPAPPAPDPAPAPAPPSGNTGGS